MTPQSEQQRLGAFALKQYKAYKLAAGKTAKSILISCSTRLAPFAIDEVLEILPITGIGADHQNTIGIRYMISIVTSCGLSFVPITMTLIPMTTAI